MTVSTLDIEVPDQARQLVALTADSAMPLGGVFHLAMYLDDNLVANQVTAFALRKPESTPLKSLKPWIKNLEPRKTLRP